MARKAGSFIPSVEQAQHDEMIEVEEEEEAEESARENAVASGSVKKGKRPATDDPEEEEDDEDEDEGEPEEGQGQGKVKMPKKRNATSTGRRKIAIEYIPEKAKRVVSFTKRKAGLMKKAFELSTLTKTQCLLVVVSETGLVYTFATTAFKPLVELPIGRRFISRALNGSEPIYDTLDPDNNDDMGEEEDAPMYYAPQGPPPPLRLPQNGFPLNPPPAPRIVNPNFHFVADAIHRAQPDTGYQLPITSPSPFDFAVPPFVPPQPLPMQRSISSDLHHSPPYVSPYHAPIPLPLPLPQAQTPYERASAEHAASYANYRANNVYTAPKTPLAPPAGRPMYGPMSFGEDSRALASLHQQSVRTDLESQADSAPMNLSHAMGAIAERKNGWLALAQHKMTAAKSNPTITNFILSFTHLARAGLTVPPALTSSGDPVDSPGFPIQGAELTLDLLQQAANESNLVEADRLPEAVKKLLEMSAGSQLAGRRGIGQFRIHLTVFFEHLKGTALISTRAHTDLLAIITPPKATTPREPSGEEVLDAQKERKLKVEREMNDWCERARKKYGEMVQPGGVEGWFEVYRVRSSYVVLKERDLKGAAAVNTLLSPFKVRVPRSLAPSLKLDDAMYLTIKQIKVNDKTYWIPVRSGSLIPTTDLIGEESDIEPAAYNDEITRLIATEETDPIKAAEKEASIRFNRLVVEELTRAVEILAQGELSGEE